MALTDSEEKRIQRIETKLAELALAVRNLAAKRQLSHLSTLLQRENEELRQAIDSLQAQLDAIKN